MGGKVEEALCSQKESTCHFGRPRESEIFSKFGFGISGLVIVISCSPLQVETAVVRNCLKQCRLSASIFSDVKRNRSLDVDINTVVEGRYSKWIFLEINVAMASNAA